jgi:inner membrane protein
MSPLTHLLASWIIAVKTTDNVRDQRLVTLAGVVPDLDGLGLLLDLANGANTTGKFYYYQQYHHLLTHGLPAAVVCSLLMAAVARRRWRVLGLTFLTFHLHLLCLVHCLLNNFTYRCFSAFSLGAGRIRV